MKRDEIIAMGMMSGSSADGLDMALCKFTNLNEFLSGDGTVEWHISHRTTIALPSRIEALLFDLRELPFSEFLDRKTSFDQWVCKQAANLLKAHEITLDFIGFHGHTVCHDPTRGYSIQIPDGQRLSAETSHPVITDFRQSDIALGGEGTPLAAVADRDLFPDYEAWINLGGIANISYEQDQRWIAYDVCPSNQLLNFLARKTDRPYDRNGAMARSGQVLPEILKRLNKHEYFEKDPPKSLDNAEIADSFLPLLDSGEQPVHDLLCTATELIAEKVHEATVKGTDEGARILLTGGGAHNGYLVDRLRSLSRGKRHYILPDDAIIDYKECLLIAWAGVLRLTGRPNMLSSVTGARHSTSGGAIYDAYGKTIQWNIPQA